MGYTILLIDQSTDNLFYHKEVLSKAFPDFTFFTISDYTNLNHQIINYSTDLIIVDIDYPKPGNIGLLTDLMSWVDIPVLAISQEKNIEQIYNTGVISYLQKPFSEIALLSAIKTAIKFLSTFKSLRQKQNEIEIKNKHIELQHNSTLKQKQ